MTGTNRSADIRPDKYEDILYCPHHVSTTHHPMPVADRAAQFAPFSALTGYEEVVKEEARLTEQKIELDEGEMERLDVSLQELKKRLSEDKGNYVKAELTYFRVDQKKEGGEYRTLRGKVRRIKEYEKAVEMEDRTAILIEDILKITIL